MINYYMNGSEDVHYKELGAFESYRAQASDIMRAYGYKQVLTTMFERYDMYNGFHSLPKENMYKLIDKGGNVLVLRPDATIPIVKMAAMHFKDPREILKFSYACTVYREESTQTKTRKHFTQAGVEYFGNPNACCEAEVIALGADMLTKMGVQNIQVDLGHIGFLSGLLDESKLTTEQRRTVMQLLDDKNAPDLRNYLDECAVTSDIASALMQLPTLFGEAKVTLEKAKNLVLNTTMAYALSNLEEIILELNKYPLHVAISIDLGSTNTLGYYTGAIFNLYGKNSFQSLASGGRYDTLSERFGISRTACGLGVDLSALSDLNIPGDDATYFDILLYHDKLDANLLKEIQKLRGKGFAIDLVEKGRAIDDANYRAILCWDDGMLYRQLENAQKPITWEEVARRLEEITCLY